MCLKTIDKVTQKVEVGWKVFDKRNGRLYPNCQKTSDGKLKTYKVNQWITDKNEEPIFADDGEHYEPGFHFFIRKHGAELWADGAELWAELDQVIKKIKVRNLVASGYQTAWDSSNKRLKAAVAKEIFIIDD